VEVISRHKNADLIMNNAFWLGVYPGISEEMIKHVKKMINFFLNIYNLERLA